MQNATDNPIRLIAVDLDGTLFNSDHRVSKITEITLKKTLAVGIQVIIVTGRHRTFVNNLLHELDLDLPYICSGGAMLISGRDGKVLYSQMLHLNGQIPAILSWANHHQTCLLAEYPDGRRRWYATIDFLDQLPPPLRKEFPAEHNTQNPMIDYAEPLLKISFLQMGKTVFSASDLKTNFPDFQFVYSGYNCLDLTAMDVDKGNALSFYAAQAGFARHEIAAIGDQTNDISMLRFAGRAYVMGQAPEEVKQEADIIAPSSDDDGAAWVMQQIHNNLIL